MLTYLAVVIAELLVLYVLSRRLLQTLYGVFFLISRSRPVAVSIVSLLTFPGTVIHELAHLFTAEILGVHTGKLSLTPEAIEKPEVRAGSVMIEETDPIRRVLIGTAPFFWGLAALSALAYFFQPQLSASWNGLINGTLSSSQAPLLTAGIAYLIFAVSNAMFSSKEDMKGFPAVAITVALVLTGLYVIGIRLTLTGDVERVVTEVLVTLAGSLGMVLAINCIGLLTSLFGIALISRVSKHKLRHSK